MILGCPAGSDRKYLVNWFNKMRELKPIYIYMGYNSIAMYHGHPSISNTVDGSEIRLTTWMYKTL